MQEKKTKSKKQTKGTSVETEKDTEKKRTREDTYENLIPLNQRSKEERKRISQMGVEARRKNKEQKMALQNCMRQLLNMKTNSAKKKQILREFGFTDEELTNRSLLMVALFQKGLTGDVGAIKEITEMMDKLEMFEDTGTISQNVTINLVSSGTQYQPNDADEQEIWDIENNTDWMEDNDDEWGTDVYKG